FDVSKEEINAPKDARLNHELADLSKDIETEEWVTAAEQGGSEELGDNVDGLVDEVAMLTQDERENLQNSIWPVKLVLVKLHKLAFKVIHSTTKLLPAWHSILQDLCIPVTNIPHDVATRWNSTYDMLEYASRHRKAVDTL
ncbi:hypothetical protein P692DRAFT_201679365, partial [Suillus brevipes Sb2]